MIRATSFEPPHGDEHNRVPKLAEPRVRLIPEEQWTDYRLKVQALPMLGTIRPLVSEIGQRRRRFAQENA